MPSAQTLEEFTASFLQLFRLRSSEKELQQAWLGWVKSLPWDQVLFLMVRFRTLLRQNQAEHLLGLIDESEKDFEEFYFQQKYLPPPQELQVQPARESVLRTQHPEVTPSGDGDIPQYFHLRQEKSMESARKVYSRLTDKYPDPEQRANLLRWHRTGRRLFGPLYWQLRNQLADRQLEQVRKTILYLLRCFTQTTGTKAWDLLSRIRTAVKILPSDKKKAWEVLEHLQDYAQKLDFHKKELDSIVQLLADYFSDVLFSRKEITLVLPKSLDESENSSRPKATVQTFDVAHMEFSAQDLKEILINPRITGLENITLSYCLLYWLKTNDADFENKIYLYSLKFRSFHYRLYLIIKKGQESGVKDEDILYALYNVLARDNSYDYNVRKDIYMQSTWRKIKPGQEDKILSEDSRALAEERIRQAKEEKKRLKVKANQVIQQQREEKEHIRSQAQKAVDQMKRQEAENRARAEKKVELLREAEKMEKAKAAEKARREREALKQPVRSPQGSQNQWTKYDGTEQSVVSIRDRVQALDNLPEKNIHHLFRSRLEKEIQHFVQDFIDNQKLDVKAVQKTLAVLAIKDFLHNHYDKPYRSWVLSNERMKVKELGLNITDVEPIIENCLRNFVPSLNAG